MRSTRPSQISKLRKSHRKTRIRQVVPERAQRLTPKQIRVTDKKQPFGSTYKGTSGACHQHMTTTGLGRQARAFPYLRENSFVKGLAREPLH